MDDLGQVIEEEIAPVEETVEAPAAPSLRESLADALAKSKEPKEETEVKAKPDRARSDDGKFVPEKKVSRETKLAVATSAAPEVVIPEIKMPKSFRPELAQDWSKLPRQLQEQLAKREDDYHKELTKHDEERVLGRQINQIITPYMAQIRAEGADAPRAIQELLNTSHILRTATPQQKGELLWRTAQTFGADMRQGLQQQTQNPVNPMLQGLQQQVQSLQQKIEQEATLKKQQEDEVIQSQIKTFSADPKNAHFEDVKAHMASLLKSGLAKDLQDAYEQAVYANPHTRSTLLQQNSQSAEEKRVAEKKAKADAAKKAGSSLKGAPGMAALKNGQIVQKDLRSELKAQFAAYRDG